MKSLRNQPVDSKPPNANRRSGSMMIEVIVASILMASLAATFLPGLAAINQQRRHIRDDSLVLVELNNLAEKATVMPTKALTLSDWFQARYPQGALQVLPIEREVTFQTASGDAGDDRLNFRSGYQLQITIESESSNLPITRSLVIWPTADVAEGATE